MNALEVLKELRERIEARQAGADMMAEHGDSVDAAVASSIFGEVLTMIDEIEREISASGKLNLGHSISANAPKR